MSGRSSESHTWGQENDFVDFDMLSSLGGFAKDYEGYMIPSIDQLKTLVASVSTIPTRPVATFMPDTRQGKSGVLPTVTRTSTGRTEKKTYTNGYEKKPKKLDMRRKENQSYGKKGGNEPEIFEYDYGTPKPLTSIQLKNQNLVARLGLANTAVDYIFDNVLHDVAPPQVPLDLLWDVLAEKVVKSSININEEFDEVKRIRRFNSSSKVLNNEGQPNFAIMKGDFQSKELEDKLVDVFLADRDLVSLFFKNLLVQMKVDFSLILYTLEELMEHLEMDRISFTNMWAVVWNMIRGSPAVMGDFARMIKSIKRNPDGTEEEDKEVNSSNSNNNNNSSSSSSNRRPQGGPATKKLKLNLNDILPDPYYVSKTEHFTDPDLASLAALQVSLTLNFSILLASCVIWSAALDSSDILLTYSVISLASHITNILISTLKHIYLYAALQRPRGLGCQQFLVKAREELTARTDENKDQNGPLYYRKFQFFITALCELRRTFMFQLYVNVMSED